MAKQTLRIGIISRQDYAKRTLAIARGERKRSSREPTVWFESLKSMAEVLSESNQELLRLIEQHKPQSLHDLAQISGRRTSNLSRTLKTLESHGLVNIKKVSGRTVPRARATSFRMEMELSPKQDVA